MKRIVAVFLSLLMVISLAVSVHAETDNQIIGTWYLTQIENGGITITSESAKLSMQLEVTSGGNLAIQTTSGESTNASTGSWSVTNEHVLIVMQDQSWLGNIIAGDYLLLTSATSRSRLYFSHTRGEQISFANPVVADNIDAFNGVYILTHVSGEGYTLTAQEASDILASLGIANTRTYINNGSVELFGSEAANYLFEPDTGSLKLSTGIGMDILDIKVFMLDNQDVAVDWFGMTFYLQKVDDEAEASAE